MALVFGAPFCTFATPVSAQVPVTVEYDRFNDRTTVSIRNLPVGGDLRLGALYLMEGQGPTRPIVASVTLTASSDNWQYLRCNNVDLLVDGEPFDVSFSHDGTVGRGYVLEFLTATMTTERFLRIVGASRIEGRVCRTEFALGAPELATLQDLASRMEPATELARP
jgi:hypothetical protein